MNSDYKLFLVLIGVFVVAPVIGMSINEWRKQDCRVELAKVGKSMDEIKEICK